jgi:hypothetical protein
MTARKKQVTALARREPDAELVARFNELNRRIALGVPTVAHASGFFQSTSSPIVANLECLLHHER